MDIFNIITFNPFIDFVHINNTGISFGLFSGHISSWLIIIIALLATSLIFYLMIRAKNNMEKFALTMIIAGALGNIVDRLINGYVIDFIYFHYNNFYWPAFNFADIYISIGIFIILLQIFKDLLMKIPK